MAGEKKGVVVVLVQAALLTALIVGLSAGSVRLWGGKPEKTLERPKFRFEAGLTVGEFQRLNNIPDQVMRKALDLPDRDDPARPLASLGLDQDRIAARLNQALALAEEEASKNWKKILLKFAAWILFLSGAFMILRRGRMSPGRRKVFYLSATLIFGVVLGSDPNAMGTIKDAIFLYASRGAVFPPRLVAFAVFMLMAVAANKFICSWGCQFGTFQDLLFRLTRDSRDRPGSFPRIKVPFAVSNSVRVAFLGLFVGLALAWTFDLIGAIDPFKIFSPLSLGAAGAIFTGALAAGSLFVYRPWCHFFCPFGLAGWLAEKVSLYRIKVDYTTCVACEKCAAACPSTVMGAILKQDRAAVPDCFSCGSCLAVCPTGSISFSRGRRAKPPEGHFDRRKKTGKAGGATLGV
ncbi:MAG: 4Fe-4S binding protein [Pseudomonadota bacterium]